MIANGFWAKLSRLFSPVVSNKPNTNKPNTNKRSATNEPNKTTGAYAGDFTGKAKLQYAPVGDGQPDPGEVVWAWVPFEEDHSQGKDLGPAEPAERGAAGSDPATAPRGCPP
jgi:hypothetical protein